MQKFLLQLFVFGVVLLVVGEVFLRWSGLASDVVMRQLTVDKMLVFTPNASGFCTRGMRAEVKPLYHINAQGWNSRIDYDQIDSTTIAVVGDSFVAGFWNDVDSTVAACLQGLLREGRPHVEVHSYGHPGANLRDYENLMPFLKKKGYRHFYIYIDAKDFSDEPPYFTNKTKGDDNGGVNGWLRQSALYRYVNVNLDVNALLTARSTKRARHNLAVREGKDMAIRRLDAFPDEGVDVVFFYQDDFFDDVQTSKALLRVTHTLQPINHGFNRHWNTNGNRNAAMSLFEYERAKSNQNTF